jgi:hypothetical protein
MGIPHSDHIVGANAGRTSRARFTICEFGEIDHEPGKKTPRGDVCCSFLVLKAEMRQACRSVRQPKNSAPTTAIASFYAIGIGGVAGS